MGNVAEDNDFVLEGGDYVKLEGGGGVDSAVGFEGEASTSGCCRHTPGDAGGSGSCWWWSLWWWAKLALIVLFVGLLVAVFFKWVGPFVMDTEVIPIIVWERKTFSRPVVALIVFGCLAILPCLLLPFTPFMWVGGMTFGYGYGFLMIMGGVAVGVSLPYFIGLLFYNKIHGCLERYVKNTSVIKLAGEGDWFKQSRTVALIRLSPFPHGVYNYCAVATDVKYGPYLLGTLVGMVPEIFIAIYTGNLIATLAEASASHDHPSLSAGQIILNVTGLCISVATTVMATLYAKRRLKELQEEEEQHLLESAAETVPVHVAVQSNL